MIWSARQQQMLRAMGLRPWSRAAPVPQAGEPEKVAAPSTESTSAPASDRAVGPARTRAAPPHVAGASAAAPASPAASPVAAADEPAAAALAERRQAIARLDWPALREAVAACSACTLHGTRTQPVFGVGHTEAHWMVVGEAPGEQEDLQGEPFVGAAGQLLDQMLAALSLTRAAEGPQPPAQRVFIANTLKCRPPRNRNPQPDELLACEPFLQRQIALVQPRIILAMGRFAIQSLLQSNEPVGKLRGRVHRYQGVPLVVTYHPAYLLRSPAEKARAWDDLCLAAQVVEGELSPSSPSPDASRSAR